MSREFQKKLAELIEQIKEKLKKIRGYRVSLSWLQELEVEVYGKKMPLRGICHIVQLDPLSFRLELWDENVLSEIERAIRTSGVSLQIYQENKNLIVKFPPLTEELKRELLKSINQLKEEYRIKSRKERDEVIKELKKQKESGDISEDDFYREKEKIDEEIDKFNQTLEDLFKQKEQELL